MTLEEEVFRRYKVKEETLIPYGFRKEEGRYFFVRPFMNGEFRAEISVDRNGSVSGKVSETEFEEEYTNFRLLGNTGGFAASIREEYRSLLLDIRDHCFEKQHFLFDQSNRLTDSIKDRYGSDPEFLWDRFPGFGVFRNERNGKWFGIIMNIDRSRIVSGGSGEVEVMNLKIDDLVPLYLTKEGIYPSYHMNKKNWVSVLLDDTLSDDELMELIGISYGSQDTAGEWIVPANPKYYDVVRIFDDTDTIHWKQSGNIRKGDTVYLYVAAPYSAILFGCEVLETDIPYEYRDKNITMKKVMKIRLKKRYDENEFTFEVLNKYGIRAIRGPRGIPEELSRHLSQNE